jgi:hypothetical protein
MTNVTWDQQQGACFFETEVMRGKVIANGSRFSVTDLEWKPSAIRIDRGMALAPYRLLARSAWMGEVREMAHTVAPTDSGVVLTFDPTDAHHARLEFTLEIVEPDSIDCRVDITSHAYYPDYELMISAYFAEGLRPGGYVGPGVRAATSELEQVRPVENPIYKHMYVAFPRDERSANLLSDGRWQRGRHFTRFAAVRYYGLPLGVYGHERSGLDVLLMGRSDDVFAVSMAYHSDDPLDDVGQHRSLYLSLLGRDIHPGQRVRTTYRMQLGEFGHQPEQHVAQHEKFLAKYPAVGHLDIESEVG